MTVTKTIVSTPDAVPPLPVFCKRDRFKYYMNKTVTDQDLAAAQAVISRGNIYVSGNVGCTKDLIIVEGGVQAQTVRTTRTRATRHE